KSIITIVIFVHPPASTNIYTLSLHDALPIYSNNECPYSGALHQEKPKTTEDRGAALIGITNQRLKVNRQERTILGAFDALPEIADRKSTRLNSSHVKISYAVFCLKKKKEKDK